LRDVSRKRRSGRRIIPTPTLRFTGVSRCRMTERRTRDRSRSRKEKGTEGGYDGQL